MPNIHEAMIDLSRHPNLADYFVGVTELYIEFTILWERYPAEPDVGIFHPYCDAGDVDINYILAIEKDEKGEIVSENKVEIRTIPEDVWLNLKTLVYDSYIPQEALDSAMEDWREANEGPDTYNYDDGAY